VLLVCYFIVLFFASDIISIDNVFPNLEWNWMRKFSVIILWIFVLFMLTKFHENFRSVDAGFTFKQNENSIKPAITVLFLFISLFLTGFHSFILLWLREKMGSLIFPILAHNGVNFVGQYF